MGVLYCIRQQIDEDASQQVLISMGGRFLKRLDVKTYPLLRTPATKLRTISSKRIRLHIESLEEAPAHGDEDF